MVRFDKKNENCLDNSDEEPNKYSESDSENELSEEDDDGIDSSEKW